jgi:hypothetical protein
MGKREVLTLKPRAISLGDGISLLQVVLSLTDSEDCAAHVPDAVVLKDDSGALVTGVAPGKMDSSEMGSRLERGKGKVAEHKDKDKRLQPTWASLWVAARTCASVVLSRVFTMVQSVCLFMPAVVAVLVASEVSDTRTCLQWHEAKHKSSACKVLRYTKEFPLHKIK